MTDTIDLTQDPLHAASLSLEERACWNAVRFELISARSRIVELEAEVRSLRQKVEDEASPRSVLSRPEFNREVARMLAFDERYGGLSSILYFDFENLSEITKIHGNSVANDVTRIVCDTLLKQIRTSDILGRLAPNEFGILLVRCDNLNAWKKGELLAASLHAALASYPECKLQPVISYGAYTFSENEDVAGGLKNAAEVLTHGS